MLDRDLPRPLEESSGPSNNAPAGESARGEKVSRVCVFEVNETLLDMSALDTNFKDLFGNKDIRMMWFGQVIQSALVATVTGSYTPFNEAGAAALDMTAARLGSASLRMGGIRYWER